MLGFVVPTDPVLNKRSQRLTPEQIRTPGIQQLIDDMLIFAGAKAMPAEMKGSRLVGLAANQVARREAIILADKAGPDDWSGDMRVLINPEIVESGGAPVRWWHGCFSTGPICGVLELPGWLRVRYLDRSGDTQETVVDTVRGVHVMWHEIKHLEGERFPDEVLRQHGQLITIYPAEYPKFDMDAPWPRATPLQAWLAMKDGRPWEHLL